MMQKRIVGLRARFLFAGILLVLTTVAASSWTLFVLSRLAAVATKTVQETDETTAATAAVASALEREDDALLVILGGAPQGQEALAQARSTTDRERARLRQASSSGPEQSVASEIDAAVLDYRGAVDRLVAEGVLGVLELELSGAGEGGAVPPEASLHHAVELVDPERDRFDQRGGVADAHQVAGTVGR